MWASDYRQENPSRYSLKEPGFLLYVHPSMQRVPPAEVEHVSMYLRTALSTTLQEAADARQQAHINLDPVWTASDTVPQPSGSR